MKLLSRLQTAAYLEMYLLLVRTAPELQPESLLELAPQAAPYWRLYPLLNVVDHNGATLNLPARIRTLANCQQPLELREICLDGATLIHRERFVALLTLLTHLHIILKIYR